MHIEINQCIFVSLLHKWKHHVNFGGWGSDAMNPPVLGPWWSDWSLRDVNMFVGLACSHGMHLVCRFVPFQMPRSICCWGC